MSMSKPSPGILAVFALLCGAFACSNRDTAAPPSPEPGRSGLPIEVRPSSAAGVPPRSAAGPPPKLYRLVSPRSGRPKVIAEPMSAPLTDGRGASPRVASQGTYWPERACVQFHTDEQFLHGSVRWRWCVESVSLRVPEGEMMLRCVWELDDTMSYTGLEKGSDEGNRNMYVVDGRGRRYDAVATTEFVRTGGTLTRESPAKRGDFVFRARGSVYSPLTFHDDDQKTAIAGIELNAARSSGEVRRPRLGGEDVTTLLGRMRSAEEVDILDTSGGGRDEPSESRVVLHREGGRSKQGVAVPAATLDRFLAMLADAPVVDGPYRPRIDHSDDYPHLSMTIGTGGDRVVFLSESQGADHVPWAVQIEGREYVIPSDAPARALDVVRAYLSRASTSVEPGAVEHGDVAHADASVATGTPLTEAAMLRQVDTVRALLAAGADPFGVDSFDQDALSAAVNSGADDILSLLMDAGRRAHAGRGQYRRAMVAAAAGGRAKVLRLLLAAGADPERGDDDSGKSPLHFAAAGGQTEIVLLLLQAGARPDTLDHRGLPPLVEAAGKSRVEVVRALLKNGARAGLQDALEAAAMAGTSVPQPELGQTVAAAKEVVRMLLAAGADPQAKMWDGRTVMDVLESMPQGRGREMLAVLKEGARR